VEHSQPVQAASQSVISTLPSRRATFLDVEHSQPVQAASRSVISTLPSRRATVLDCGAFTTSSSCAASGATVLDCGALRMPESVSEYHLQTGFSILEIKPARQSVIHRIYPSRKAERPNLCTGQFGSLCVKQSKSFLLYQTKKKLAIRTECGSEALLIVDCSQSLSRIIYYHKLLSANRMLSEIKLDSRQDNSPVHGYYLIVSNNE
jgi:hypothetical protein